MEYEKFRATQYGKKMNAFRATIEEFAADGWNELGRDLLASRACSSLRKGDVGWHNSSANTLRASPNGLESPAP
jgi:hypothetical protein